MLINLTPSEKSALMEAIYFFSGTMGKSDNSQAKIDYNIMMGNLEDPEENEGGED